MADGFPTSGSPTPRSPLILPRGSRREFLGHGARGIAAASAGALLAMRAPAVHAAGTDQIEAALIGCGGRGGGAAVDALSVSGKPVKIVALADIFKDRAEIVRRSISEQFKDQVDVPDERMFIGFDAYDKAIDALKPGDIAIFATPVAFRAAHFAKAIEKGCHVFMEKPVSIDGPSTKRIIELAAKADAKKLKVGVGLMCRHCDRRRELFDRLRAGEAGELMDFRGYRMHTPAQSFELFPGPPEGLSELLWQIRRFHGFLWASGGIFSDYYVHHIDEVCWMKGGWPVKAEATGGRHYKGRLDDQNFDSYSVEYTFDDGTKFFYSGRHSKNCDQKFGVFGQGTKGAFTISASGHSPAKCAIYKGQKSEKENLAWTAEQPEPNPYRREWEHLVAAILADEPYNEAVRGAEASLATAMGRVAAHTGKAVTFDDLLNSPDDLTAGVAAFTADSKAPVTLGPDFTYPVPMPGRFKYEYHD
jgi:predicted dehydrogenase